MARRGRGIDLVDVVWKGDQVGRFVVQRDVEVLRRHELADDLVDRGEQVLESRRAHRHLGNAIGRGLQLPRTRLRFAAALDVERTKYGGTEAMQVVLHDVIRRSRLQVLHGRLVPQPSGHDDDRRFWRELLPELGILWIVLDQEDTSRRGHGAQGPRGTGAARFMSNQYRPSCWAALVNSTKSTGLRT